jgi:hypothetical protein
MKISNIDELIEVILSDQFTDNQIKQIIERALVVLFVFEEMPPREELAEKVREYFELYPNRYERPIFFGDLDLDVIDFDE